MCQVVSQSAHILRETLVSCTPLVLLPKLFPLKSATLLAFGGDWPIPGTLGSCGQDKGLRQSLWGGSPAPSLALVFSAAAPPRPPEAPGSGTPRARGGAKGGARRHLGRGRAGGGLSGDSRLPPQIRSAGRRELRAPGAEAALSHGRRRRGRI